MYSTVLRKQGGNGMRKKVGALFAVGLLTFLLAIPASAASIHFDVKMNDIYSNPALKGSTSSLFFIDPDTYTGTYVRVRSKCSTNANYTSDYLQVQKVYYNHSYSYRNNENVAGGLYYRLDAYGAPAATWNLVGTYTP